MRKSADNNSPFRQFADGLVEEWSQRKFFGIKTNEEATDRLIKDTKVLANELKIMEKKLKTLEAIVKNNNSFGLEAFLPKVEEGYLDLASILLTLATITRKWRNRK